MGYMAQKADDQIEGAQVEYQNMRDEIERLQELVRWAYGKLHRQSYSNMDDALKLDEMKLECLE